MADGQSLRATCGCGSELVKHSEPRGNWGDWTCAKCGQAFCQDCGAVIDMLTMQCTAYEAEKESTA